MNDRIERSNLLYQSHFAQALRKFGASHIGKIKSHSKIERLCPEFQVDHYKLGDESLYISKGCHLFSEEATNNRDEFVIHNFYSYKISLFLLNLVCFYHISKKTLIPGDICEVGKIEDLPNDFNHVAILIPHFFPMNVNRIVEDNIIYNLSWILPISNEEFKYIDRHGMDDFEYKLGSSKYDFFDLREDFGFLHS